VIVIDVGVGVGIEVDGIDGISEFAKPLRARILCRMPRVNHFKSINNAPFVRSFVRTVVMLCCCAMD